MTRHGSLFPSIVKTENLYLAYQKARKGKGWQHTVKRFEAHLHRHIKEIQQSLIHKTFTTSSYVEKRIYEPKERIVYKLPFNPDRIVQHALMNIIEPIWDRMFIHDSYSCRVEKGIHAGSRRTMEFIRHVGPNAYCLKMDISKFYPSMVHDILLEIVNQKIKCPDTLWLLHDIIYSYPGGKNVPIGNYTSQWFGNLYLNELDQWLKHTYKARWYIRYCDDFLVLHSDKVVLHDLSKEIQEYLTSKLALHLSQCRIFPVKQGIDFLGYRHFPTYILLRKSTAKRVKNRIRQLPLLLQQDEITEDHYRSSIASTLGWLKWANTYHLRHSIGIDDLWDSLQNERHLSSL